MNDERESLRTAYGDLCTLADGLSEADSVQPPGCIGWAVRDLLLHQLSGAQRGLVALVMARPDGPCDRDAVTYWTDSPGPSDPESGVLRATWTIAGAYRLDGLQRVHLETLQAVVTLASRVAPSAVAPTQGHTQRVENLLATLVTEAALHHLDLVTNVASPGSVKRPADHRATHPRGVTWPLGPGRLGRHHVGARRHRPPADGPTRAKRAWRRRGPAPATF